MKKYITVLALIIFSTAVIVGCGNSSKESLNNDDIENNKKEEIKKGDSTALKETDQDYIVMGVKLNMEKFKVKKQLGEPNNKIETGKSKSETWDYSDFKVYFTNEKVISVLVESKSLHTNQGISVGDFLERVPEKHGKPYKNLGNEIWYLKDEKEPENINLLTFYDGDEDGFIDKWGIIDKWLMNY